MWCFVAHKAWIVYRVVGMTPWSFLDCVLLFCFRYYCCFYHYYGWILHLLSSWYVFNFGVMLIWFDRARVCSMYPVPKSEEKEGGFYLFWGIAFSHVSK